MNDRQLILELAIATNIAMRYDFDASRKEYCTVLITKDGRTTRRAYPLPAGMGPLSIRYSADFGKQIEKQTFKDLIDLIHEGFKLKEGSGV